VPPCLAIGWDGILQNIFCPAGLKLDSPDLCHLSSWDYRCSHSIWSTEYFLVLKGTGLSSHKRTWKDLKRIFLRKRSWHEGWIPIIWHSEKEKLYRQ
jgi:hypothetical protein